MPATRPNLRDNAIMTYLQDELWLLSEPVLTRLVEIVDRHAGGQKLQAEEIANLLEVQGRAAGAKGDQPRPPEDYRIEGSTAVIPIRGVIAKYASQVNHVSQPTGTSIETIQHDLARALEDPKARDILLKIESPGGSLSGIANLAAAIREASVEKPVIAYADDVAASAAYWIGAQAQRFYASPTAAVGSIGIYSVIADTSDQAVDDGVKLRIVRSARFKGVGEPGTAIDDADLEDIQDRVDAVHDIFVQEVAAGRGMAVKAVAALADGRIYTAPQAKATGLIDGIRTLREALDAKPPRLRANAPTPPSALAASASAHTPPSQPAANAAARKATPMPTTIAAPPPQTPDLRYEKAVDRLVTGGMTKGKAYYHAGIADEEGHRAWVQRETVRAQMSAEHREKHRRVLQFGAGHPALRTMRA